MEVSTLLANPSAIRLDKIISARKSLSLIVSTKQRNAPCPRCCQPSARVHSRYRRTVADLPWHGVRVKLELHSRRFFCDSELCPQRIFCERLPSVVAHYARKTMRLSSALELIGFSLGGEAGARLARELGMSVCPDTLLAYIRRAALPELASPRVLGVDDWAQRKAHTYGTILVDLERRRVLDLLPNREAETFAAWLKAHPGVEVISRDRGGAYAEGARQGAPLALQVADRWHLLKNLGDALERMVNRQHDRVRHVCRRIQATEREREAAELAHLLQAAQQVAAPQSEHPASPVVFVNTRSHERRLAIYTEITNLHQQGMSQRAIARRLRLARNTVRRYVRADGFPEADGRGRRRGSNSSILTPFIEYLKRRFANGCTNAARLWQEVRASGYRGSVCTVRRFVSGLRVQLAPEVRERLQLHTSGRAPRSRLPALAVKSTREVVWLLLRQPQRLKADERHLLEELFVASPDMTAAYILAQQFLNIVRGRLADDFDKWLPRVGRSNVQELRSFAAGLWQDRRAVRAALTSQWSQGQVEGQVNRLKMIKRQMYGRANLDLLRARVLHRV